MVYIRCFVLSIYILSTSSIVGVVRDDHIISDHVLATFGLFLLLLAIVMR